MKLSKMLIWVLLMAMALSLACAQPTPSPAPAAKPAPVSTPTSAPTARPTVTLYHLDLPMGIGQTELHIGRDDLLRRTHPWLRISTQETQGAIYNLKVMIDEPQRYQNTIVCEDLVSIFEMAPKKKPPFTDGYKQHAPRALYVMPPWTWTLQTEDPKIQTLQDLAGKKLGSGAKAGTMNWTVEQIFLDAGIHGKVTWQHMTFADIAQALLNRTLDAGFVGIYYNPFTGKYIMHPPFIELQASGRPYHLVDWAKEVKHTVDRMGYPAYYTLPPNTLPGNIQPKEWTCLGMIGFIGADASFPEDTAYELTKWTIQNVSKFGDYHALGTIMTPEFLAAGLPRNLVHPGALRAYKEAGLDKLLGPEVTLPEKR